MPREKPVVPKRHLRALIAVVVGVLLALTVVACSSGDTTDTADAAPTTTDAAAQTAASDGADAAREWWRKVPAPPLCMCSDGSEFHYWVHEGAPEKVLFYLSGGGACFSAETCASDTATYTVNLDDDDGPGDEGIFDLDNPDNPLAGYSMVVVPYCTGDLHLGTAIHDYGGGVVVHHDGYRNGSTALAAAAALFPDAEEVVVAGSSAGSAAAPMYGGLAHDVFGDADISVIADASAAYPGTPEITLAIGSLWGIPGAIPPWPETEDVPVGQWSLPGLFVMSSRHDPGIRFATYNNAYDEVQAAFSGMIGRRPDQVLAYIDENNAAIAAQGVDISNWVAPGTDHTVLGDDDVYEEKVAGTKLVDWLTDFVEGKPVEDVHCTDCRAEDVPS